ncbi:cation/calcium exchanger 4-like [Silene latifolia]|uniref:cation/calcium exchanger 4-like n=1 Tax=Silene latifolia TaxID=37657 RepID=UPI003D7835D1
MRNPRFRVFFSIISTIVFFTLLYEKWSIRSSIVHGTLLKNRRIMHEIHGISSLNVSTLNIKDGKLMDRQICSEFLEHKGYDSSCDFLIANPNCSSGGFFNYIKFFYCNCQNYSFLGYFVLGSWLAILFYLLGNTAADYFCCSLENLSNLLKMSPTIAGVTLLPLGNGASDVFASIAAFMGTGSSGVGLNGVLGGAVFITCIVVGVISLSVADKRVQIDKTSFIRNVCFLLFSILCLTLIIIIGKVTVWGALAFLSIYFVYIGYVSVSEVLKKKDKGLKSNDFTPLLPVAGEESITAPLLSSDSDDHCSRPEISAKETHWICDLNFSMYSDFVKSTAEDYCPRALWGWSDQEEQPALSFSTLCSWLEMPLTIPRRLTIPIVEEDRWSKMYAVASALLAPVLLACLWNSRQKINPLSGKIAYCLGFGIGLVLSVLASLYTKTEHPPRKFLFPWIFGGFFMSIIWFYIIANELVSLLVALGTILGINPSMLALTVLAWGNSMNDLMANTAFAMNERNGVQIAMSGCFAGPMFNTLVGLGLSLVYGACSMGSEPYMIPRDAGLFVTMAFLTTGVVWSLVVLPQNDMRPNKVLGIGLIVIYVLFLSIRISMAIGIGSLNS